MQNAETLAETEIRSPRNERVGFIVSAHFSPEGGGSVQPSFGFLCENLVGRKERPGGSLGSRGPRFGFRVGGQTKMACQATAQAGQGRRVSRAVLNS
jgi:hypothetical protein